MVFAVTKAANRLPALRQRIRGDQVVEHEVIHPTVTVMGEEELFGLTTLRFSPCFETFAPVATADLAKASEGTSLEDFPYRSQQAPVRDDVLTISILPWLAFTGYSFTRKPETESIPVLAVGKVERVGEAYRMPFFVNFHHALADGIHIARYMQLVREETVALARQFESSTQS